jgi:hypothetical protein
MRAAVEHQIREDAGLPAEAPIDSSSVEWWLKDRFDDYDSANRNRTKRERAVTVGVMGVVLGQLPMWQKMAESLGYSEPLRMPLEESTLVRDLLCETGWPLPWTEPEKSGLTLEESLQAVYFDGLVDEPVPWSEARKFFTMLHDAAWMVPGDEEERRTVGAYQTFQRDLYRSGSVGALAVFKCYAKVRKLAEARLGRTD